MAKRKLTHQQQQRIRQQQRQQLAAPRQEALPTDNLGPPREGVVITRFSRRADILPVDFEPGALPHRCHIRANCTDLVTGDRVIWRQGEPGVVEQSLPRYSQMSRPDSKGNLRPVAANIDRIGVVIAAEPLPHDNLIDRYLVAAEHQGIPPFLILNKADLAAATDAARLKERLSLFEGLGYTVLPVSAATGEGMAALRDTISPWTTVLVGQSGVGKSSLINLLHPEAEAAVGELSRLAVKGKHTTTAATLYALPSGGRLIDSPGIREFGLWHLDARGVAEGFIEFRPFIGGCKFRDCLHLSETDCAIVRAAGEGRIQPRRLASYRHIIAELN